MGNAEEVLPRAPRTGGGFAKRAQASASLASATASSSSSSSSPVSTSTCPRCQIDQVVQKTMHTWGSARVADLGPRAAGPLDGRPCSGWSQSATLSISIPPVPIIRGAQCCPCGTARGSSYTSPHADGLFDRPARLGSFLDDHSSGMRRVRSKSRAIRQLCPQTAAAKKSGQEHLHMTGTGALARVGGNAHDVELFIAEPECRVKPCL